MGLREFFRSPSRVEAGISEKYAGSYAAETMRLSDGPLWHAFAEVSPDGIMKPNEQAAAHRRMAEFFERHPNTEQSFKGLTQNEAKKKINDMDTGSVARAA